ncbi:acetyl-CoA carboxylase family protein [Aeromicrobium piscarium]|uniref:Biotin/lipoyl-binding protein n=1 Tax=Aeromicrobium piscarium TaxID=2590901 RepID=A0A554SQD9_9ACTN|nr:carboxyl transferase domain-containing protein [Aeromicrobium piscarium]TSD68469.1 biotin/lipoyl-binding protein [Aeromicrobium piscarium]
MKVLIANRGEIAVRIARAVRSLGWVPQHVHAAGEPSLDPSSHRLPDSGVSGYLNVGAIIEAARQTGSEAIHPGYGFLSESPELAEACASAGLVFVGPDAGALQLFGDKGASRDHARSVGVPVLASTPSPADTGQVADLLAKHPAGVMVKAVVGGGGRGMRAVTDLEELESAVARCSSEAQRAFGRGDVYAERLMPAARHIEVQVIGDGQGRTAALAERDCSVQRRHQKVLEIAPSPALTDAHRERLMADALALLDPLDYRGLATVEFLVDADELVRTGELDHVFIEVNPRLQVEHTITEELLGTDLVTLQLQVATGRTLGDLGVADRTVAPPAGRFAIQSRVNAEQVVNGTLSATTGTIEHVELPTGARVDTYVTNGTVVDGTFDSLLAKVVTVTEGDFAAACADAVKALDGLVLDGVGTNIGLLREILIDPVVTEGTMTTAYLDERLALEAPDAPATAGEVAAPLGGTVLSVDVEPGTSVGPRRSIVTLESMKMEHPVTAGAPGTVTEVLVHVGEQVAAGQLIARLDISEAAEHDADEEAAEHDLDHVRPDLAELRDRVAQTRDAARPEAVARRHAKGHLTARESIDALVDAESFLEYGTFPVAAQRSRRDIDDLIANTPADGIITGLARIDEVDCAVLAYDYTVLAGTQGYYNHKKTDRMIQVARQREVPLVLFAEGGGGRPGDTDTSDISAAGLNVTTFAAMGSLSGLVPTIGIVTGRCFAGNAALLGCCDVIIGTEDANLGMAGPAMIEGGGLGQFSPEDIGPMDVQSANGVVDILVEDDTAAIRAAQRYLSYFTGRTAEWTAADQRRLRHAIGENRKQVYDIRRLIELLADDDSVLELRAGFAPGAITALVRIEGRAVGLIANNPAHLGGAIDADGADKMARFLQLCDAHGLPVVSLCDTPGFMVGPESEKTATVRHFSRLFVISSHLRVPVMTIVLRKGYGLGAQAMAAGSFMATIATIAWPTGEIGGMGLEGAVRLGFSKELDAITDPGQRERRYQQLIDEHYETGKAINGAMKHEFDEVIDPADSRRWILATLGQHTPAERGTRYIDTW